MAGEAGALADAELVHSRSEQRERVGERVLRDGARGREPGVGERTRPLAVEDFDRAAERRAARARQAHVGVEAGVAGDHARDPHLWPAGVRDAVAVAVGLVRVVDGRAVVAGVAQAVVVGVLLAGVGDGRAVVVTVADAVVIGIRARRAGVAYVADAVEVAVELIGVGDGRAVVAGVTHAVAVAVGLVGVVGEPAIVHRVADTVEVAVDPGARAVVAGVADAVAVLVAAGRAPGVGDACDNCPSAWSGL